MDLRFRDSGSRGLGIEGVGFRALRGNTYVPTRG